MRIMILAGVLLWGAALAQTGTQPRQPGERVFVDPQTGDVVRFRQIERPGQAPLFQVNPTPLPAHERGALLRQAEQNARVQQQAGQGTGGQGSGAGSRHNVRGGSPTQPTWNQDPRDRRAYTAQDARADAARSDAARRAEMARRGLQWRGN
jgi:hypothetical protein